MGVGTRQGRGEEMVALQGPSQWWFLWSLARTLSHQRVESLGCLYQLPGGACSTCRFQGSTSVLLGENHWGSAIKLTFQATAPEIVLIQNI